MTLFRLDSSIQGDNSTSRAVADTAQRAWEVTRPGVTVVTRDLAATPIPADAWQLNIAGSYAPEGTRTPQQQEAIDLAATLADELLEAEAYIFAAPLYNWGVSQHMKAWIDLVLRDPRTGPGQQPLAGRPAVLVVSRGGGYGPGAPKEGWDHATPYYRRIFADQWGLDLHVNEVELTLAKVTPAMADLIPQAEENLANGHSTAEKHGRLIAERAA
ncbi:FMN-dependent NADH-azoreductase [Spongisporangium articulatum]|uniref:FMN dependent NADH:quinone oxidoreductase n=1 Tax=Spongisporangium articulatum TaxID=3362603 RepID=A0ABW8APY7_9ACTN